MAQGAPIGNRFWEKRSTHGRKAIFATPEIMEAAASEYFEWCENNPLVAEEVSGGKLIQINKLRAFTIQGICSFFDVNVSYFSEFLEREKAKNTKKSKDFTQVITRIYQDIYNQKFTGASANLLNANIIARDLGLTDKKDLTTNGENINTEQVFKIGNTIIKL